ncbi:MAG: TonB family protein [Hydrogenophilaceae bacterium]|nr:TonB family protein [Hydrogenophilaceae bacterium]
MVKGFIENSEPPEKTKVQKISLVKPPPPKPEEKPPEPEKIEPQDQPKQEEVQLDEPPPPDQPASDAPPPGEQLGLDSDGSGSGDGFGLAARKGGRDITTIGPSKGSGSNPWAWYDSMLNAAVNSAFQQALAREQALKDKNYKVVVKVWIDEAGKVTRAFLVDSTGDTQADEVLKEALREMRPLREGPPNDMPQPVKIRVTSRA